MRARFQFRIPHSALRTGFTLIELLIAVAISATVLVVVDTLFFGALRLRSRVTEAAEGSLPVDNAVETMRRDLLGAVPPGVLAGPMGTDATSTGTTTPPMLELFSTDAVIRSDQPWGEVQKIDYSLQTASERGAIGRDLVRGVTRNLLPAASNIMPDQRTLLTNVQYRAFSFYDGTNWNDSWSTSLSNLPVAVKVTIDFAAVQTGSQTKPQVQFLVPVVTWDTTNSITNQLSN